LVTVISFKTKSINPTALALKEYTPGSTPKISKVPSSKQTAPFCWSIN
jgi:hypothetical protein